MKPLNRIGTALALSIASLGVSGEASAFDMDCKVILCLAGGFPSGCADARSYMLKRLKKLKPPFGVCTTEGENGEGSYSVPANLSTRKIPPSCSAYASYATGDNGPRCIDTAPGRIDGIISITIPQDGTSEPFRNDYVWYTRPWSDDSK